MSQLNRPGYSPNRGSMLDNRINQSASQLGGMGGVRGKFSYSDQLLHGLKTEGPVPHNFKNMVFRF